MFACTVIFIFVCRSKNPTGLMFRCLSYSTLNKSSMSMSMSNSYIPALLDVVIISDWSIIIYS